MIGPFINVIPGTGIAVSALGLGTVKIGRDRQVKYPTGFTIPDDKAVSDLLAEARELGINLIDTAPAYGNSEERLGKLLRARQDWVIATKVGEEFIAGQSRFDFSAAHTRMSIERSLQRLHTDYLDIVLIHSDGNDEAILENGECLDVLRTCQREGKVRAVGMSAKTDSGGMVAASLMDLVMITWNQQQQDRGALETARAHGKGVLVKKGLMSGHAAGGDQSVQDSLAFIFREDGIQSVIVGTINPDHLRENARIVGGLFPATPP